VSSNWRSDLETVAAIERGQKLYPGRPFPPAVYGFEWTAYPPDWVFRGGCEQRTAQVNKKDRSGQVTVRENVQQWKVPLKPPANVIARHAEMAEAAKKGIGKP